MDKNRSLLLLKNLILDEIYNITLTDYDDINPEQYINYLQELLKKISVTKIHTLSQKDRQDIILLLMNRISIIDSEFEEIHNSDLSSQEIYILSLMQEDCNFLLNKLLS